VALDHHFTDDVMAYASFNTGFKSGGYNLTAPGRSFGPEKLKAYETGLKTELLDRTLRLNVAAFLYKYTNQQVSAATAVAASGSLNFSVINAGASNIKGLEANFDYVPTRRLTLSGGMSLIRGRYTNFPGQQYLGTNGQVVSANGFPAGAVVNVKGSPTVLTPKFVGNLSASYKIPTSAGDFVLDLAVQHNSGFVWSQNSLDARQESYTLINSNLSWTSQGGGLGLKVWAKNISNKYYYSGLAVSNGYAATPAPPRTVGVTLSYHYR
jgi:iron complex outermembrane recepter protein